MNDVLYKKTVDFFSKPKEGTASDFSKKVGLTSADFEKATYSLLSSFWANGRAKDFKGTYDPEQLKMGIEVEFEHTDSAVMAERIAKDHLAELPDYYTRLKKMEDEGKAASKLGEVLI